MAEDRKRLLVVQVAALGMDLLRRGDRLTWQDRSFAPLTPPFPALTCCSQATFRTAAPPREHGVVANGRYVREIERVLFWEQSAAQVAGPRIWDAFRTRGGTVGMLFWQHSLGEAVDLVVSPQPIHKHSGGMMQGLNTVPRELEDELTRAAGRRFQLGHYWGPLASVKASAWIAEATAALLRDNARRPDLCLTYLPGLDYDLQRFGPDHPKAGAALEAVMAQLDQLHRVAAEQGYAMVVFGDYAIGPCGGEAVFPNRALRTAGLLSYRTVRGREYPDLYASRAFAMVDHEIAHVYVRDAADRDAAARAIGALPGVETCEPRAACRNGALDHPHAGELVAVAAAGHWFAYPWWTDARAAPDYATHIDIHNKPGYDPCELFFGRPPWAVSQDTRRVRGSHGRLGAGREAAWWTTLEHATDAPEDLAQLGVFVERWLNA